MDSIKKSQADDENWDGMTNEIVNSGDSIDVLLGLGKPPVPGKEESGAVPVEAAAAPDVKKIKLKKLVRRRDGAKDVPKHIPEEGEDSTDKKVSFLLPQNTFFLFQCIVIGKSQKCSVVLRSLVDEYVKQNASVLHEIASRISGIV